MNNIIFLDIDGVLISLKHNKEILDKTNVERLSLNKPFDWYCLRNLYILLKDTDSNIVLSSGWRKYEEGIKRIKQILSFANLEDRYVGETPYLINKSRNEEISYYLNNNNCDKFVIIDDMIISDYYDNYVRVNRQVGLSHKNVEEAKRILKKH